MRFVGEPIALVVGDAGAYPTVGAYLPLLTKQMIGGTYRFDSIQFSIAVATTNTTPPR